MVCSKCGNENEESSEFCSKCGNSVKDSSNSIDTGNIKGGSIMNYLKERNMVMVVLLSIVTCGIYSLYIFFALNGEVNKQAIYDGVQTQPRTPIAAILLSIVTCGIYAIVYQYFVAKSLQEIGRKRGYETMDPTLVIVLTLLVGIGFYINVYSASEISKLGNIQN